MDSRISSTTFSLGGIVYLIRGVFGNTLLGQDNNRYLNEALLPGTIFM